MSDEWIKIFESDFYVREMIKVWDEGEKWANWIDEVVSKYKLEKKVLDIPCGIGRVSYFLANRGYKVTGIDISERMISMARSNIQNGKFIVGDMRKIKEIIGNEKYDLVINIYNSLGYYSEEDDLKILESLRDSTRKIVVINLDNRDYIIYNRPNEYYTYIPPYLVYSKVEFEQETSRLKIYRKYYLNDKEVGEMIYEQRLYSIHEILALLKKAGLQPIEVLSGYSWKKFSIMDPEMTIIATPA
ncbi:class I SAM-dependent methyltransferase [Saccharolobus solfataricus]|uniref:SAM-dependent methyltransferase, putative n=3 Tax=Saccharolobus solfataricus TaxID=2287 RepID=Q97WN4_SACS2|nr:class I SAM-dependent methyltransferase [Saccharolobus solfataricus]AAK42352.1 SAM-dependent methyltransferase, putative [Saccharolobus solfataricus P2]AKA74969.1 class I SAM-dependent methyltransferase [Saccharolobus solfataricus]AKA77665.1 class I SAM-dependent methyltransferase [Saccharolobus solfataricus]AKA80356.1 class I SAM-dependent methyltransferase [Saccharolobus solfataricus]AZF69434.1 class I SAM-dependent methyltransferase [Saccharolobus solfataricus]